MFPSLYTKADAIQHPDDPECCFHPVLVLLYDFFLCSFCRGLLFPTTTLPREQSWSRTAGAQPGCTGCKVTPALHFLLPSLGQKCNFQAARVRFPLRAHIVLPFPPQVAISQVSFNLGYCEMPILSLGKNKQQPERALS